MADLSTTKIYGDLTVSNNIKGYRIANLDDISVIYEDRSITAGNGLSGGGALSNNLTISMGTPSTITTSTTNSASGTTHTHALTLPATMAPSNHNLIDTTKHPVSGLTTGHFLKATGATTYGFAAHGLTYSDVGALANNHAASGVTTTKISNWDAAYTHAGTTHYAEPGIFSGGGTPTLATGVTAAEIRTLIGASASHTHPYLSNSSSSTQSGYFGNIYLKDDTNASHYLIITDAEDLTANRTLSLDVDNADRTLRISGNAVISGTNTGDQTVGNATLTLAAGTGVTLSATPSFTANATTNKTITITNSSPNVTTNISITHNTTTVSVNSSDGTDGIINGATSTTAGVVTTGDQTWAGVKTFNSAPESANGYTTGSATMVYNSTSKTIDFVFV